MLREGWDQLLLAARQGDEPALARLIELAGEDLRKAALKAIGRRRAGKGLADDVFAETLVTVLREIGRLRATNYIGFRYWFASIARNQVRQRLRGARKAPLGVDEALDLPRREKPPLADELRRALRSLDALPRAQQVAYALREGLTLSWSTIGFVLGRRTSPAARLVHYRASAKVRSRPRRAPAHLGMAT